MYGIWINSVGFGLYTKPIVIDIRENNEITLNESSDEEDIIDTEINPISETSVLNLNTEVNDVDDRMSSEMDSVTNLIELEIEDIITNRDRISENSETESSDDNKKHILLKDETLSSSSSNNSDSFNIDTNTSTEYNNNH